MGFGTPTIISKEQVEDKNPDLYVRRAEDALRYGRYREGLNEIEKAINFSNKHPRYRFEKAKILLSLRYWKDCKAELEIIQDTDFGKQNKDRINSMLKEANDHLANELPFMQRISYKVRQKAGLIFIAAILMFIAFLYSKDINNNLYDSTSSYQDHDTQDYDTLSSEDVVAVDSIDDQFAEAVYNRDYEEMKRLLLAGANLNNTDEYTAILLATIHRDMDLVNRLIQKGADVNIKDSNGENALMDACRSDNKNGTNIEIAKILLQNKVDVNAQNNFGESALLLAVSSQDKELVSLLLASGADKNLATTNGETPITLAKKLGNEQLIELINPNTQEIALINSKLEELSKGMQIFNKYDSIRINLITLLADVSSNKITLDEFYNNCDLAITKRQTLLIDAKSLRDNSYNPEIHNQLVNSIDYGIEYCIVCGQAAEAINRSDNNDASEKFKQAKIYSEKIQMSLEAYRTAIRQEQQRLEMDLSKM